MRVLGLGEERTWKNLLTYYENLGEFDTGILGTELLLRLLFKRAALHSNTGTRRKIHHVEGGHAPSDV